MNLFLKKYEPKYKKIWDSHVTSSHNGTFLFQRGYMDYHSDRFVDHSIMFFFKDQLLAILPASEDKLVISSHGGLTYGGIIYDHRMTTQLILSCFKLLCSYYKNLGFTDIVYKPVPHIYHSKPAEEDLYALHRCNATLFARGPSSTINLEITPFPGKKLNGCKRGIKNGLDVIEVSDPTDLILEINNNLHKRHQLSCVHNSQEMHFLKSRFNKNIELFELIHKSQNKVGGAVVYLSKSVAHIQYMVVNDEGRPLRGTDVLLHALTSRYRENYKYLDFGISSENNGFYLNESLISQKEAFSATVICYDIYNLNFRTGIEMLD